MDAGFSQWLTNVSDEKHAFDVNLLSKNNLKFEPDVE